LSDDKGKHMGSEREVGICKHECGIWLPLHDVLRKYPKALGELEPLMPNMVRTNLTVLLEEFYERNNWLW
jgi:hypothetical protein